VAFREGLPVSHDFMFWESAEPLENEEASEIYTSFIGGGDCEKVEPSAKIALLAQEIQTRWPVPDRGREDDWPLAAPTSLSAKYLGICLVSSRLWDVWPMLGQLAELHGLVMYDPQQHHVFLPRKLSQKRTRIRAKKKRP
jgi:hypothetical protein